MVAGSMEADLQRPLAAALGSAAAIGGVLTATFSSSRVGVEGVDGVPTLWNRLIGKRYELCCCI